MSSACRHWRSSILNDEHCLNQWFSRSLEHSQQSFDCGWPYSRKNSERKAMPYIDESLFPVNIRSNEWYVLPWSSPSYPFDNEDSATYYYPISLFRSSHCFSFWLFLPRQCYFNIHILNLSVQGVSIWLKGDKEYSYDKGKRISIGDRWIHVVVASKSDLQSNYQLCLDGQYLSKLSWREMSFIETSRKIITRQNIVIFRRYSQRAFRTFSEVRIADLVGLKRCLAPVEIRAILQQQTSIKQVKVGTYIQNNEPEYSISHNNNSNSFSLKFIFLSIFVLLLLLIIGYFLFKYANHA